jgi:hypothetical protein
MRRLETAQKDCMDDGQAAAAILLQDARGLLREQARRIEVLEAALRQIEALDQTIVPASDRLAIARSIARAALAPEQGK